MTSKGVHSISKITNEYHTGRVNPINCIDLSASLNNRKNDMKAQYKKDEEIAAANEVKKATSKQKSTFVGSFFNKTKNSTDKKDDTKQSHPPSSIYTNQKEPQNNKNETSPLPPLPPPATPPKEPEMQLPQPLPLLVNKNKEKEDILLDIYDSMLKEIRDFKASQEKANKDIADTRSEIVELRKKKEMNAVKIKDLQVELYDLLKQIKVTDDDLSTIQKKLAALSGKLSNFPPNSKKSFSKRNPKKAEIVAFFKDCWTPELGYDAEEKGKTAQNVENLFQVQQDIDYALVSVLVEKLVMDYFITYIFGKPIYMDFDQINTSFKCLQDLFNSADHSEWSSNLRLKCVKATLTDIEKDSKVEEESKKSRAKLCDALLEKLSVIYDKTEITSRIKKLVEMAADLSFPMNSQEEPIEVKRLLPDEPFYTNQVKAQYGSDKSPTVVKVGISPVFLTKNRFQLDEENADDDDFILENDTEELEEGETEKSNIGFYGKECTLVYTGRAIGYNNNIQQEQAKLEFETNKPHPK